MCLAVPGKILDISGDDPILRSGRVDFGGVVKEINLSCVPDAKVGDYVLAHVGIALNTIDQEEAAQVFEILRQMDALADREEGAAP
jgi:hydrogenase expression/formation protein HypC